MNFKKDFPSFDNTEDDPVQRLEYQQRATASKLEKISHRITLVSFMIPLLIISLLAFVYFDIRGWVISSDNSKQTQMEAVSKQITEKLNSLDSRLAQNKFDLDNQLPKIIASANELTKKINQNTNDRKKLESRLYLMEKSEKSFERRVPLIETSISNNKTQLDKINDIVKKNTKKNTAVFENIESINKSLILYMDDSMLEVQKNLDTLNQKIQSVKKEKEQSQIQFKSLQTMTAGSIKTMQAHIKRLETSVATLAKNLANISSNKKNTSPYSTPSSDYDSMPENSKEIAEESLAQ